MGSRFVEIYKTEHSNMYWAQLVISGRWYSLSGSELQELRCAVDKALAELEKKMVSERGEAL